jgi:cyclin B
MDRYLEKHDTERNKLQLVGITSLFLACKFEEIHSPQVADCVYLTDSAYEKTQILQMETDILATLDYQLIVPTGYHFLTRFLNRIKAIERVRLIASYIAEKNLQEIEVLTFPPRIYAAASVYIAIHTVNVDVIKANPNFKIWTEALEEESGGLREQEVLECAKILLAHMKEVPQASTRRKLDAAKKKYSTAQTQFISDLDFPNIQK